MIQLSSVMWAAAIFFALIGFLRGWKAEFIVMAGIALGAFAITQFDAILRGTLFATLAPEQIFQIEAFFFIGLAFVAYHAEVEDDSSSRRRRSSNREDEKTLQDGILGALVGAINGYIMAGMLWYLLDINNYAVSFASAPGPGSPSDQTLGMMPMVLINGGVVGSNDFLAVIVVGLLFLVVSSS